MSSIFRGSRKVLFGLGIASCGAAAAILLGLNDERNKANALVAKKEKFFSDPYLINPVYPSSKWDHNWDKRDPYTLAGHFPKGTFFTEEEQNKFNERLEKAKVKASRHLLLIRHGQYNLNGLEDQERRLTQLGIQQATLIAKRLRDLNLPYSRIVQSTMSRAKETAQYISQELPEIPVTSCGLIREGAPYPPDPINKSDIKEIEYAKHCYEDGPRIESAFRHYFHRADPKQKEDSYEILVCHANVIRYFVCRALQFPPEAWLRFSLHNCSLTWIAIRPSGKVIVYTVGDVGHIPRSKMTTK